MLLLFTVSIVILDREWLKFRHKVDLTGMLKFVVPKAVAFVILTVFLFFSIYLRMVAEFSD